MLQIQSTWSPFVDRNPQRCVSNIFAGAEDDFITATHRVSRSGFRASALEIGILGSRSVD